MSEETSHRQILRSTTIIGGASVINILIGLVRVKVAALLLGPAGIGLIGLLQSLMSAASTVCSAGLGVAGTRQIAEAVGVGDYGAVMVARRAIFWGTLTLSIAGACLFWLLRDVIARQVMGSSAWANGVGWLAFGVFMTVASGSQVGLLTGLRRIGDIARVSVASAALSTVLGIAALTYWGKNGLLAFVLAFPLASLLMGHVYIAKLPKAEAAAMRLPQLFAQWRTLVVLGSGFMIAGLIATIGHLALRSLVQHQLGAVALGQFQAAWTISITYIGFILTAMGTDYYPRLTSTIRDRHAVNRMVNEQTEVAVLLSGPLFLMLIGLAPWVIELLYSNQFVEATTILRWQVLGDIFKVASFPLAYILLASRAGLAYVLAEMVAIGALLCLSYAGIPFFGVKATGMAVLGMYLSYAYIVYWIARYLTGFCWQKRVRLQITTILTACVAVHLLSSWNTGIAAVCGSTGGCALGLYAVRRLASLSTGTASINANLRAFMSKFGHRG